MTLLLTLLMSFYAHADYDSRSFTFSVASADPGCVKVQYFYGYNDFPNLPSGTVSSIRFYYSSDGPDSLTQDSPFQESTPIKGENDELQLSPNEFCGFKEGKYAFKYGLVDEHGTLIEFQDDFDPYSNTADVEPVQP